MCNGSTIKKKDGGGAPNKKKRPTLRVGHCVILFFVVGMSVYQLRSSFPSRILTQVMVGVVEEVVVALEDTAGVSTASSSNNISIEETSLGGNSQQETLSSLGGLGQQETPQTESSNSSSSSTTTTRSTNSSNSDAYIPSFVSFDETNDRPALPIPIKVMKRYIQWHSHEALMQSSSSHENRTFAIGYYSCPMYAGNRMFQFLNSLKWAIITNRTLLWKYYDRETCRENQGADIRYKKEMEETGLCNQTRTKEYCAQFLQRASWIPSYEEWKDKLDLGEPERLDFWSTTPKQEKIASRAFDRPPGFEKHAGVDAKTHLRFVNFPIHVGPLRDMLVSIRRHYLLKTAFGRETALSLYQESVHFLYGMLFTSSFDFVTKIEQPPSNSSDDSFSIGILSRHRDAKIIGRHVGREQKCVEKVFSKASRSCSAYVVSDRQVTVSTVSTALQELGCTVHALNQTNGTSMLEDNNSPTAPSSVGGGFYQDLQMLSHARNAFVASASSNSDLVQSLMEYNGHMEAWRDGRDARTIGVCELKDPRRQVTNKGSSLSSQKKTSVSSSSAVQASALKSQNTSANEVSVLPGRAVQGDKDTNKETSPGTRRPMLKPLKVMEQYIRWHSEEALQRSPHNRTFAIGYYACPMQAGNRMFHFMNSLKWAIVTNRTLLWKYYDTETCRANQGADPRFKEEMEESKICESTQTEAICAEILTRASWIPSYDAWKDKLSLGEPERLHLWSVTPTNAANLGKHYERFEGHEKHAGVDAKTHLRFVNFPILPAPLEYLRKPKYQNWLVHTEFGRETAVNLYKETSAFLYGMLFRKSFDFAAKIPMVDGVRGDSLTIAIHSRHQSNFVKGRAIGREQKCIEAILPQRHKRKQPCDVFLMADRKLTLLRLSEWLKEEGCTPHIANKTIQISFLAEHGPFAGRGYYDDLQMVSQARDAFIGTVTTSSQMGRSLIEYNRRVEAWRDGREISKLTFCETKAN